MIIGRKLLNLVTNEVNLEILGLLRNEPSYPRMLAEILGKDETHVSKRLRVMEKAGIVKGKWRRVGRKNVRLYSLNTDQIEIVFDLDGCKVHLGSKGEREMLILTSLNDLRVPALTNFVGRTEELRMLESQKNFFLIEGMAGIGKTSLASKFVEGIKESHCVFWHALKEVDSFNFLINKLAVFLSRFRYLDLLNYLKAGGTDDATKMALLLEGMDSEDYAVVFDDYQRCRDEKIDTLLGYLQKNLRKARVVVLSRVRPKFFSPLDANVIERRLSGLDVDETLEFLSSRGVYMTPDEAAEIQERLSGHPLALNMFCEAFKEKKLMKVLESLPEYGLLEYFWNEVYQGLDEREQTLLRCMSVFRYPITARAIMSVSSIKGIRGTLYSLERKMVVGRLDEKYFLHEVIRDLCYRFIDNPKEMHRQAAEYYLSEETTEALLEAIHHMIKAEDFQKAAQSIQEDLESKKQNCIERGYLSQYLDLLKSIPAEGVDEETWCWILYGKGRVHLARGEFMKATENLSRSLTIAERLSKKTLIAKILKHLGKAYLGIGDLKTAENHFTKSLELLKDAREWSELGSTFLETALLYLYKGDLATTKHFLDMGLSICEKAGDERNVAMGYYHYAGLYEMKNDWEKAIKSCERSLRIFKDIGDVLWIANLHTELAFIKTFLRRFNEALEHFDVSIKTFERTSVHIKLVEAYSDRALLHIEMGNLEEAGKDCEKALQLKSQLGDFYYYGVTYRALGMMAAAIKDWIKAEEYFGRSVGLLSSAHQFHLAKTYLEIASMYEQKHERTSAIGYLNRSLEIFRRLDSREEIEKAEKKIEEIMSND